MGNATPRQQIRRQPFQRPPPRPGGTVGPIALAALCGGVTVAGALVILWAFNRAGWFTGAYRPLLPGLVILFMLGAMAGWIAGDRR